MWSLFLFKKTSIFTFSGSKQLRVGDTMLPAQLKTRSESADVGGIASTLLDRGVRWGKCIP